MDLTWFNTLPEPVKALLLGAAGDFLGGLAADVTGRLVDAAGYQVKKRFRPEPQQVALNAAMAEALFVTASSLTDDPDTLTHYLGILGEWLARDAVVGELSQVIDPRPGAELDVALLAAEFEAAGFEPDLLGEDITFERVVGRLVQAFYDAASKQPELQGQMEIGLLRGIAENTTEQVRLLRRVVSALERPESQTQPAPVGPREGDIEVIGHFNTLITGTVIGDLQVHHGDTYELSPGPQLDPRIAAPILPEPGAGADTDPPTNRRRPQGRPRAERADRPGARRGLHGAVDPADRTARTPRHAAAGARGAPAVGCGNARPRSQAGAAGRPRQRQEHLRQLRGLCLAGEGLGRTDANLALMTTPLPQEEERRQAQDEKPEPQPWRRGALLPVRVVLRDFAAHGLPAVGTKATGDHLWRFIVAELGETLADYEPHLKRELHERGGLILLDGLDEVPEADERRVQVKQAVQGFSADFPRCRFVVTSRTYAYQRQDWKLPGFSEAVLAPFSPAQINQFVDGWYAHMAAVRGLNRADAQGRATLLKDAIRRNDRLRQLAERPLLLTLMASLHAWRGGNLPEKREELYADTVDCCWISGKAPKCYVGRTASRSFRPNQA